MDDQERVLLIAQLQAPFDYNDIEWRVQRSGKSKDGKPWASIVAYVDNRAIMNRLDAVVGPARWKTHHTYVANNWQSEGTSFTGGMICELSILFGDVWVTKSDGAFPRQTEPFKSSLSDSMKRAANQWGIGRYLYQLPFQWAGIVSDAHKRDPGVKAGKTKDGTYFYWAPPAVHTMPDWMLPTQAPPSGASGATTQATKPPPKPPEPEEAKTPAEVLVGAMKRVLAKVVVPPAMTRLEYLRNIESRVNSRLSEEAISQEQRNDVWDNYLEPALKATEGYEADELQKQGEETFG